MLREVQAEAPDSSVAPALAACRRPLNEDDVEVLLQLWNILSRIECGIARRELTSTGYLTAASRHLAEYGHEFRVGCCAEAFRAFIDGPDALEQPVAC